MKDLQVFASTWFEDIVDASTKILHLNDGSEVYHSLSGEASTISKGKEASNKLDKL